jgi:hypothetical protein
LTRYKAVDEHTTGFPDAVRNPLHAFCVGRLQSAAKPIVVSVSQLDRMLDIVGNRDRSDWPEGSCSNAMLIHASAEAMDFPKSSASLLHLPAILTANSYQKPIAANVPHQDSPICT